MTKCPICNENNRKREQKLIDVLFEIVVRQQMNPKYMHFSSREDAAAWVAQTLKILGFDTQIMGSSWGVLK